MIDIHLKPLCHRGQDSIGMYYENHSSLNGIVRKLPGARWSQTKKVWYVPLNAASYNNIHRALNGKAEFHIAELREYLQKKKKVEATRVPKQQSAWVMAPQPLPVSKSPAPRLAQTDNKSSPQLSAAFKLSNDNLEALQQTVQQLTLKAYSSNTIRTYRGELLVYFQLLKHHAASTLTTNDVKRYLQKCLQEGLSENTLHSRINALKFYYEQVLGRDKFFFEIPRPKRHLQLPNVLGEQELTRLFNAIINKKHKAILFMAYSAGLRVSEVVNMKIRDVDSDRMQLFVEKSKGKKDRYVTLSPVLLDVLRNYIKLSKPRPLVYLFEGQGEPGVQYSARSAQKVFQLARGKAGIKKEVSFHCLRHSFATHILEKGVDIRYIKDILGHFSIKTTERYLHVKKEQLIHISSPLDDIWKKGAIEW